MVTSARYKPVHHNCYMKTYALMEEMDLPLAFHAGYNWERPAPIGMMNKFISVHALGFVFYNMVPSRQLGDERAAGAVPQAQGDVDRERARLDPVHDAALDNEYMMRSSEAPALKKLPSDYMRDMFYSSQPMEMTDMGALETTFRMIKAETQLLYSSDYPHWDFDLPSTIYDLPFLDEQAKRNILGGNALRVFNLTPA